MGSNASLAEKRHIENGCLPAFIDWMARHGATAGLAIILRTRVIQQLVSWLTLVYLFENYSRFRLGSPFRGIFPEPERI